MARGLMPKSPALPMQQLQHLCSNGRQPSLIPPSRISGASAIWLKQHARHLANVRDTDSLDGVWFSRSPPQPGLNPFPSEYEAVKNGSDRQSPDERTLKLGKTIRILHKRLPTLLISPLPQDILSPQIKLNLFPSTHPHLPSVSGKIAYSAALCTAPVAWGRVPLVGNVKLSIVSERMIKNGVHAQLHGSGGAQNEELLVKWRTCGKSRPRNHREAESLATTTARAQQSHSPLDGVTETLSGNSPNANSATSSLGEEAEEFSGLFIFSFDSEGRIVSHTIEHAQQGGNWEKMTSRVITVTDWLLGRAKWRRVGEASPEEGLALGYGLCGIDQEGDVRSRLRQSGQRGQGQGGE